MPFETQDGIPTVSSNSTPPSSGGATLEVQDNGNPVALTSKINFSGQDISVVNDSLLQRVTVNVPREDVFQIFASKKGLANNIWLKNSEGIYYNISPFLIPINCELFSIAVYSTQISSFSVEIYKNTNIVSVPNQINAEYVFSINGNSNIISGLSIPFFQLDKLGVYLRGISQNISCGLLLRRI